MKKRIFAHLTLWGIFLGILLLVIILQQGRIHPSIYRRIIFGIGLFYLNYAVLIPRFLFKKRRTEYAVFAIISLTAILLTPTWLDGRKIGGLFVKMRFFFQLFTYLFFFVAALALRIYEQWIENEKREQKIIAERATAELHYLKNQINPHFLFNSLNNIYALTVKKSDNAPEAVLRLSELMRYMLHQSDNKFVELEKEVDYIEDYIALQKLRIADKESVLFETNGNLNGKKISPLLLIAFIENAFKFGTNATNKHPIKITLSTTDTAINFDCENPIDKSKKERSSNGIGLSNARKRLELLYPEQHKLTITENEDRYCVDLVLSNQ